MKSNVLNQEKPWSLSFPDGRVRQRPFSEFVFSNEGLLPCAIL